LNTYIILKQGDFFV